MDVWRYPVVIKFKFYNALKRKNCVIYRKKFIFIALGILQNKLMVMGYLHQKVISGVESRVSFKKSWSKWPESKLIGSDSP